MSARWSRLTSSARLCRSSQAVSVVQEHAYIFGGELLPREPIGNDMDIVTLDVASSTSVRKIAGNTNAPSPRVGSPSTKVNGKIWLFSGRGGLEMRPVEESGALWCFDVARSQWESVNPLDPNAPHPAGRSYHCITSDDVNNIYIHAGCPENGRLADLWRFDIEKRAWSQLPAAPGAARGGASIAYLDGRLYRMNGFDGQKEQGGVLDVFDLSQHSWSSNIYTSDGVEGPEARSVATLLPITFNDNKYLVTMFGERDPSSLGHAGAGKMLSNIWVWDVRRSLWQGVNCGADMPAPRGWFDADVWRGTQGDTAIVHGGLDEENKRLGDVWMLSFE